MKNDFGLRNGSVLLSEYSASVADTDILSKEDLAPALMGLYGEVGGIMSTVKKQARDTKAYPGYRKAAQEEFGDTLWYLAAVCRRLNLSLETIFHEVVRGEGFTSSCAASDRSFGAVAHISTPAVLPAIDEALFQLGRAASSLLDITSGDDASEKLRVFVRCYLTALNVSRLSFADIVHMNIAKTRGAFIVPDATTLPTFDDRFQDEERIPAQFKIRINQRSSGKSYLRWNDVFIGDPLTDNISDPDGYRFHDVFHFAHAAILHWSPVFRALIKQKRKSKGQFDETQDSGRAIVVEEGLTAWIFSRAKDIEYFEGHNRVSLDLLKTIQEFTAGYEVSSCPLKLWERAILDGYKVFRQIRSAEGGWVIGDRGARTVSFSPLEQE